VGLCSWLSWPLLLPLLLLVTGTGVGEGVGTGVGVGDAETVVNCGSVPVPRTQASGAVHK